MPGATDKASLQPAYVLHSRPYRDTSLLLEVLTPEFGRVGLIARGARGPKSKIRALLQPFRGLLVSWTGRGELYTLSGVEEVTPTRSLHGDGLASGFYLNELLMRLTERHDPHPRTFGGYVRAIESLAVDASGPRALRLFEKYLLEDLGYGLLLDHDAVTLEAIEADQLYCYEIERGPIAAQTCAGGVVMRGHSLISLHNDELEDLNSLQEAKRLMRSVLGWYLGALPLRSREMVYAAVDGGIGWSRDDEPK